MLLSQFYGAVIFALIFMAAADAQQVPAGLRGGIILAVLALGAILGGQIYKGLSDK